MVIDVFLKFWPEFLFTNVNLGFYLNLKRISSEPVVRVGLKSGACESIVIGNFIESRFFCGYQVLVCVLVSLSMLLPQHLSFDFKIISESSKLLWV